MYIRRNKSFGRDIIFEVFLLNEEVAIWVFCQLRWVKFSFKLFLLINNSETFCWHINPFTFAFNERSPDFSFWSLFPVFLFLASLLLELDELLLEKVDKKLLHFFCTFFFSFRVRFWILFMIIWHLWWACWYCWLYFTNIKIFS